MNRLRARLPRLRRSVRPIMQASLAAPLAWLFAHQLLSHPAPIFAPIVAIITIGSAVGRPWKAGAEIVLGVAIGIAIADALTRIIGHGTLQIGLLIMLAMIAATLLGGGPVFVMQAAISGLLVASLPAASGWASVERLVDTLSGGTIALLIALVIIPVRPLAVVRRVSQPLVTELSVVLRLLSDALTGGDVVDAAVALERMRATGDLLGELRNVLDIAQLTTRIAPARRRDSERMDHVAQVALHLDLAARDVRVLSRVSVTLIEYNGRTAAVLAPAVDELARGVSALGDIINGQVSARIVAVDSALDSVRLATQALATPELDDLTAGHFVGQMRSTCVDILRATGSDRHEAMSSMFETVRSTMARDQNG